VFCRKNSSDQWTSLRPWRRGNPSRKKCTARVASIKGHWNRSPTKPTSASSPGSQSLPGWRKPRSRGRAFTPPFQNLQYCKSTYCSHILKLILSLAPVPATALSRFLSVALGPAFASSAQVDQPLPELFPVHQFQSCRKEWRDRRVRSNHRRKVRCGCDDPFRWLRIGRNDPHQGAASFCSDKVFRCISLHGSEYLDRSCSGRRRNHVPAVVSRSRA
jgi:hypothetical protein